MWLRLEPLARFRQSSPAVFPAHQAARTRAYEDDSVNDYKPGPRTFGDSLKSQDFGMMSVKAVAVFLVVGSLYVFFGGGNANGSSVPPSAVAVNLAPIGRVEVEKPAPAATEAAPSTEAAAPAAAPAVAEAPKTADSAPATTEAAAPASAAAEPEVAASPAEAPAAAAEAAQPSAPADSAPEAAAAPQAEASAAEPAGDMATSAPAVAESPKPAPAPAAPAEASSPPDLEPAPAVDRPLPVAQLPPPRIPNTFTPPVEPSKFAPNRPTPYWAPQFSPMPPRATAPAR
jgi:hypothetical protein